MIGRIYPYRTLFDPLEMPQPSVSVTRVKGTVVRQDLLEGESLESAQRQITLTRDDLGADWESISIGVTVRGTERDLAEIRRVASGVASDMTVVIAAGCRATQMRQAHPLKATGPAAWEGAITLHRHHFYGEVRLRAILSGTIGGRNNRYLGESEPWVFRLDEESRPPRGGSLSIKWVDFRLDSRDFLQRAADQPSYVDLQDVRPVVYLNLGFENLPELFPTHGRPTGPWYAVHETHRASIAQIAWVAMFQAAMAGVRAPGDGEQGGVPDWPDTAWQQDVLRQVLPLIYEHLSDEAALAAAWSERASADGAASLESKAAAVIKQKIVNEGKLLHRATEMLDAIQQSERDERRIS